MVSRSVGQSSRGSHCRVLHKVGVMFHVNQGLASHTPPIFACHNKHFSSGAYKRGFCSAIASDSECTGYANRDISNPATATNHGFHRERAKHDDGTYTADVTAGYPHLAYKCPGRKYQERLGDV